MPTRIFSLLSLHQRIDDDLRREQSFRWPDPFRIQRLKKLKLRAKDLLHRLATRQRGRLTRA